MPATGPRTSEGKAASARNATRHGLLSQLTVLPGIESQEEWEAHHAATLESLTPVGQAETLLAERIALLYWRLARLARYEVAITRQYQQRQAPFREGARTEVERQARHTTRQLECSVLLEVQLLPLQRYEAHLSRDLHRAFQLLRQLQQNRAAAAAAPRNPSPPSAANPSTPTFTPPPPQNCETNSAAALSRPAQTAAPSANPRLTLSPVSDTLPPRLLHPLLTAAAASFPLPPPYL